MLNTRPIKAMSLGHRYSVRLLLVGFIVFTLLTSTSYFNISNLNNLSILNQVAYAEGDDKEASLSGSVVHQNDLIQTRAGEGFSQVFCFPKGSSDPSESACAAGGIDQLGLLDIGISRDGTVRSVALGNLDTVQTLSFFLVNNAQIQRSQAIYSDDEGAVRITQTAETKAGSKSIIYTLQATNIGGTAINDFRIGVYADWDVAGNSDFDIAQYNVSTDTALQEDSIFGGVAGISSSVASSAHDLHFFTGPTANAGVVLGAPNGVDSLTAGDTTVSLAWNLGSLNPGQTRSLPVIVAVGNSQDDLNGEIANTKAHLAQTSTVTTDVIDNVTAGQTVVVAVPDTGTASTVQELNIPLAVDGTNVSFTLQVTEVLPEGVPTPPADTLALFIDIDFTDPAVSGIDFSDPNSFSENPSFSILVNKNLDSDPIVGDPFNCPEVLVFILNEATAVWEPATSVIRDPSTDVGTDTATTDDDRCGYEVTNEHFSRFSVGGVKRPSGAGGSDAFARTGSAFADPAGTNYDAQPPIISEMSLVNGKVTSLIKDNVGVKDAKVILGKKSYSMQQSPGNPFWWERMIPSEDLPSGEAFFKISAWDYNNNIVEKASSGQGSTGSSARGPTGGSLALTPSASAVTSNPNYSIVTGDVKQDSENKDLTITIKNTGKDPLNNIRVVLSPELKGKFLLNDYAIKSIAPGSEATVLMKLNGKPNVNVMGEPIPYNGQVIISVDNRSPYILELFGGIPNESVSLQSIFMKTIASKGEQRYKDFVRPDLRISEAEYDVKLGSGEDVIKSASDELIIRNNSDKSLKNLRIITSAGADHFIPEQKNIDLLPAGSFIKVKLVSKLNNAEIPRDIHGEVIIAPENGIPIAVPVEIGKRLAEDRNTSYEVSTMYGNDYVSNTADSIVIRNNSEESIDNVRIILPQELARIFSLSEDTFRSIQPNSEEIINIQPRGSLDVNVRQILNDYKSEIIIVSSDGMKKILPVNIVWKGISSAHFVVYARDNSEELAKAAQIINFLERSYAETAKLIGETNSKTVIYMTNSHEELELLSRALAPSAYVYNEDVALVWSNSEDVNILALKEFAYRTIMQNYGTYWAKQKISMDKGNWLVDGISNYVTASIVGENGMIKKQLDAFAAEPASFEWYGASTASQQGASLTLFKFLAEKYGDAIIDKTLYNLGSTMVSNHRCDTVEQCALLKAVYDVSGMDINDKRHDLSFDTIVEEWKAYVQEQYAINE